MDDPPERLTRHEVLMIMEMGTDALWCITNYATGVLRTREEFINCLDMDYLNLKASDGPLDTGHIEAALREDTKSATACICPRLSDTGGYRIADLACPVHGIDGTDPGDGYWEDTK